MIMTLFNNAAWTNVALFLRMMWEDDREWWVGKFNGSVVAYFKLKHYSLHGDIEDNSN
jgi:hypothetical protein